MINQLVEKSDGALSCDRTNHKVYKVSIINLWGWWVQTNMSNKQWLVIWRFDFIGERNREKERELG